MLFAGIAIHFISALKRAFARIVLWFALTGLIAAIIVELAGIIASGGRLPTGSTHLVAFALAVAVGYAAAMTVLVGEIVSSLFETVRGIGKEVEEGLHDARKIGDFVARSVEYRERHL